MLDTRQVCPHNSASRPIDSKGQEAHEEACPHSSATRPVDLKCQEAQEGQGVHEHQEGLAQARSRSTRVHNIVLVIGT